MGKTTEQWKPIFQEKNRKRKAIKSKSERALNRKMGRALSARVWLGFSEADDEVASAS